jgi:hypothetical protein
VLRLDTIPDLVTIDPARHPVRRVTVAPRVREAQDHLGESSAHSLQAREVQGSVLPILRVLGEEVADGGEELGGVHSDASAPASPLP